MKNNSKLSKFNSSTSGFTIVELLVVIIIIGVLSTIVFVSFRGITARANETVVISDLANAKKQLALYHAEHGQYPTAMVNNCPTEPIADNNYCIKPSSGTAFTYFPADGTSYSLKGDKGTLSYQVTNDSSPTVASASPTNCPTGFILVPGSATYGTSNFCVMKYEAKNAGSNVPVSTPTGAPWVSISQTDAMAYSPNTVSCTSCHLISEAEWMTLAQNVMGVNGNWSGGTVGNGFIYQGHINNNPSGALVADASDANGAAGITLTGSAAGTNTKRTLTLSNGNVIWDMSGNVTEWTSGQVSSAIQPGVVGNAYSAWLEYPAVTTAGSLPVNVTPAGTGISGAGSWTSTNGIGQLLSNPADAALHGFFRGGNWANISSAGVLSLSLSYVPLGNMSAYLGFRVAAPAF